MTTKRKRTQGTADRGLDFVSSIVHEHNCILQKIDDGNDIGNDAYIEFVENEKATSFVVAAQIKSGPSYTDGLGYKIPADRDHFCYWHNHILPVIGIVVDPDRHEAGWLNISAYLKDNPSVLEEGPYTIRIPPENEFSNSTFPEFAASMLRLREQFMTDANFGLSIESFSEFSDVERCFDGLQSLFHTHRHRRATWLTLVSSLRCVQYPEVLRRLVVALCHVPGHPDIFWHKGNLMEESVRIYARHLMASTYSRGDVEVLLAQIDELGFQRGSIGQCIFSILLLVPGLDRLLHSIAFSSSVGQDVRFNALLVLVRITQAHDSGACIEWMERLLAEIEDDTLEADLLEQALSVIREYGSIGFE